MQVPYWNYPQLLTSTTSRIPGPTLTGQRVQTYRYSELSPEYTRDMKINSPFTLNNCEVTPRLMLYYGGRTEYYRMSADQISASRFPGFRIGDFAI